MREIDTCEGYAVVIFFFTVYFWYLTKKRKFSKKCFEVISNDMRRYLIYLSYIGTRFRGVQKQFCKGVPIYPDETVQSILEAGLSNLKHKPVNQPVVYLASRTDQGVHALCTAAHVDLEFPGATKSITDIVHSLNKYFMKRDHDIRILSIQNVPETFSARYSAIRKRYLYRFAVVKSDAVPHLPTKSTIIPMPILEKNRCHFVFNSEFDSSQAEQAARLFIGFKDFRAFMGRATSARPDIVTERHIEDLTISKGCPLFRTEESDHFNFWEVACSGRSFLYKQVRRTVGVLIAVGQGKLSLSNVEAMFLNPTNGSWNDKATVVPGCGLYLLNVDYNERDLLIETDSKPDVDVLCL